jgi:hypothetical protein
VAIAAVVITFASAIVVAVAPAPSKNSRRVQWLVFIAIIFSVNGI